MRKLFSAILALCLFATIAAANNILLNPYRFGGGSPPASLAIANTNTYSLNSASTSHDINLPSGISAGNLVLIFACKNNTAETISDPSGFTLLLDKDNNDNFLIWGKIATGSEGATVNTTLSSGQRMAAVSYLITGNRNGLSSSEIAISSAVDASTATPDPPNHTPSWGSAENLWIALSFASDGGYTYTQGSGNPTNYTLGELNSTVSTGNGCGVLTASRLLTASSEDPGAFTTVTARNRSTYTLAIRPQ